MSMQKFDIDKFNGTNDFAIWKVKMRALLVHQGCAATLNEESKLPEGLSQTQKIDILSKAHSTLLLCLTDDVIREVIDEDTAAGLWKKLEEKYQKKSLTNRLYQKQRLYTLRMEQNSKVQDHINHFNRIILDLNGLGVKVEDEDLAIILLCSLPTAYENFVDTMLYGRDTISVNDVKDAMLSKELKRRVSNSHEERTDMSLTVRGRSKERGPKRSKSRSKSRANIRCFFCKEKGHIKRDCPQRKKGKEKKKEYNTASTNVAQEFE